ncbi:MAG: ABC transporter substrate-binding protein [Solibacillus sp.]
MRKLYSFVVLLTILTVLTACSSAESAVKTASGEEKVTLRIAQTGWGSHEEALKHAGLDKDLPYNIEYSVFQGGNLILEAMNAGHVDFGSTSEIPPIFSSLSANGDASKIIAVSNSNTLLQEIVVPKDSPIKTPADLKGKKVAYVQNTTAQYFLVKILEEAGLTWDDIDAQALTTADGLTALLGNNVDALASYGNSIITAKERGATTLTSAETILSGNFPLSVHTSVLEDDKKRAALVDFLERLNKSYEWQRENIEQWAEIYAENTKQPVETALQTLKDGEKQRPTKIIPITNEAITSQQDIADTFLSIGLIDKQMDISKNWDQNLNDDLQKLSKE